MTENRSEAVLHKTLSLAEVREALAVVGREDELKSIARDATTLTLWAHVSRRCWLLGATHEHETYVVDQNGNRYVVDKLVLHQNIGGDKKDVDGGKTSQVGRTETEVNFGCRSSCARGTATHWGITWSTDWVCV